MINAFVDFVNFNRGLNYQVVLVIFGLYVLLIWFIVVLWAYFDAKKRYLNPIHQILIGLATFFLGIPFVLLYLLIRPDEIYEDDDEQEMEYQKGGVNIPMINFVGKEGVEMTLTLNISPKVNEVKPSDLKIGVSVEPNDDKFEIKEVEKLVDATEKIEDKVESGAKVGGLLSNLRVGLETLRRRLSRKTPVVAKVVNVQTAETETEEQKTEKKKGGRRKRK